MFEGEEWEKTALAGRLEEGIAAEGGGEVGYRERVYEVGGRVERCRGLGEVGGLI